MLDLPENELFSAYIDGELTAEEQADVERILNDNPEARQLVDELRSLSSSLQALPTYKLDEDLASRVLRQAEREMLAEPATPLPKFHQVDVPEQKPTSWARRLLRPRNYAWSAVAIAVAVILMLNEPSTNNDAGGDVAANGDGVTIQPLDVVPTVEAISDPGATAIAESTPSATGKDEEPVVESGNVAPVPEASMVAEKEQGTPARPSDPGSEAKPETDPLLVLQCQLAQGQSGHKALTELLKEAGVDTDEPLAEDGKAVEVNLTTNQLRQVVSLLQKDTERFSSFAFQSTARTAAPRIPSPLGPGGGHAHKEATEGKDDPKGPKATYHVQGTITIQPHSAAPMKATETTAVGNASPRTKVTPKIGTPKNLPVKEDRSYRVRFLLKPPVAAKNDSSSDN